MFILIQSSKMLCLVQKEVISPNISNDVFLTFLLISLVNDAIAINSSKVILVLLKVSSFKLSFFLIICSMINSNILLCCLDVIRVRPFFSLVNLLKINKI